WPPNHKMVDITVDYRVLDNCGPVRLALNVASNEAIDGTGDGHTAPDWQVADEHHVQLRAERAGNGSGRVYTIGITAVDSANQSATQSVTVRVPHDRSMRPQKGRPTVADVARAFHARGGREAAPTSRSRADPWRIF